MVPRYKIIIAWHITAVTAVLWLERVIDKILSIEWCKY
jgi:hypothetical protein